MKRQVVGRVILAAYAITVVASILIVLVNGKNEGNALPAVLLTFPWGIPGAVLLEAPATIGQQFAFTVITSLGALFNVYLVNRMTRSPARANLSDA